VPVRRDNATFLFERPFQRARSEHYWTSLLAMFLVHLGRRQTPPPIPTWHLDYDPPHWSYSAYRQLETAGITWDGLFVEPAPRPLLTYVGAGRLRPTEEQILANYLGEARRVGPDLVIFRPEASPQITLIEVKAAGERLEPDTIKRYRDAERMLADRLGSSAAFMLVCAIGDTRASGIDEREINRSGIELILWDRVIEMMAQDDAFNHFLPPDALAYTKSTLACPCPRPAGSETSDARTRSDVDGVIRARVDGGNRARIVS
jgi:hypothetical protein